MLRDIRYRAEYLPARIGLGVFRRLPLPAATIAAHMLADTAFLLDRRRKLTAVQNILRAGLESEAAAARNLARRSFRHFALLLAETLHAGTLTERATGSESRITWRIHPQTRELLEDPDRHFVLAAGHLGNWEIGAQALAQYKPLTTVARHVNNPYLEAYLRRINPRRHIRQMPKYGADPFRMLNMPRSGEILALMIDQHARKQSVWLDFFGRPAASYTAVALLPLILRCPLCFGSCIRKGTGRFEMSLSEPLAIRRSGDRSADTRRILAELNRRLEQAIRQYPEQYLWAHRRWRDPPAGEPRPA